jgi:hypothetical protein
MSERDTRTDDTTGAARNRDEDPRPPEAATDLDPAADPRRTPDENPPGSGAAASSPGEPPLFSAEDRQALRGEWDRTQTAFVDDPRAAVEQADRLVVESVQILSASFSRQRADLEEQWGRGQDVSTEDLRVALQRYRSFFERLLRI